MSAIEDKDMPTLDEFESLFVNNPDLDTIRSHLSRFNPIKTMGMERMEIRHSAILGWLLSPQETHGLGDAFLKAFLAEALRGHEPSLSPSALAVSQSDMMDAEVRREWRHIDLIVLSPRNGWVFLIENKFDSSQQENQLSRYMDDANSLLMGREPYRELRGIFLTLWGEDAADERYASIEYATICELLKQTAFSGSIPLAKEVEIFLRHYLDVILEATGMSNEQKEMEKLARQIYRDHRRVLDFIVEHGHSTVFSVACEALIGEEAEYPDPIKIGKQNCIFNHLDTNNLSFLPKIWFEAFGKDEFYWHGCEDWWAGFPLIMWVQLTTNADDGSGQVRLYAEVGPLTDHAFRCELIESIKEAANEKGQTRIGFQRGATDEGRKYSKFLKKNFVNVNDVQDHDEIISAIAKALDSFQTEIEIIGSVLPRFKKYGNREPSDE